MTNAIILGSLVLLAAGCVQGITGFGLSLLALPLLGLILGIREAVPILVLLSIVTNLWVAKDHLRELRFRTIASMLIPAAVGVPAGIWLLAVVSAPMLKALAGGVIVLFAAGALADFSFMRRVNIQKPYVFGFLSGVLNGSISLSGPPIIAYFAIERLPKDAFRSNLSAYFFLLNIVTIAGMIISGACSIRSAAQSLYLLPALIVGTTAGVAISRRIHEAHFRRIAIGLLLALGVYTLVV
jgi:uncharacterized protein